MNNEKQMNNKWKKKIILIFATWNLQGMSHKED
jgi:hypothetical protein